jgi:hypothetical protein
MALVLADRYPDNTNAASADYPQGSAKNDATPGDHTGTPYEKDILNDIQGFLQALLLKSGITPSGAVETALASDYWTAVGIMHKPSLHSTYMGTDNTHAGSATGEGNVFVGHSPARYLTTGSINTAIGYQAMSTMTTGSGNVAIGESALTGTSTGSGNIAIGPAAAFAAPSNMSNTLVIGANGMANATLTGNLSTKALTTGGALTVTGALNATGAIYGATSSRIIPEYLASKEISATGNSQGMYNSATSTWTQAFPAKNTWYPFYLPTSTGSYGTAVNRITGASFNSNGTISLPAGKYRIQGAVVIDYVPTDSNNSLSLRLYIGSTTLYGDAYKAYSLPNGGFARIRLRIAGEIDLIGTTNVGLYVSANYTNIDVLTGFADLGVTGGVYNEIEIWRLA